ncbi:flagellar basal body rod protein FlgB [Gellertiella hungarica]|uniref:Flagellar basal body rod protein FlgB n=1 Tax=Gellertiella hungarica TaxID=1572859 RepID=A0A7W6J576_9HYPH|nr:flagellar basal body rod protein FlgB [Gellertiella hungarica]MBB4064113.1 flagellar basal-body rod protein FlgB [Gellertiella hungarica]
MTQPIQLFDLASRQAEWLSIRQEVVASNIANANTPKYRARDVTPFNAVLDSRSNFRMARTNAAHLTGNPAGISGDVDVREAELVNEIGVQESGNTVGLAEEMTKSGEIKRQYELNAALVKSFHRMMLMTVRK